MRRVDRCSRCLMAIALPAAARVTVAQLEQILTKARAAHKSDVEMVRQIGRVELSERLTETRLELLTKNLAEGPQTTQALRLLADQSAFLDPPASELPSIAPPDDASKQRMLDAARNYVAQTLPRLPNFLATRTTVISTTALSNWGKTPGLSVRDCTS